MGSDSNNNPVKDIDSNPTEEEEVVAVLDEDIYCSNETETNSTVNDESRPIFRTVKNVQLDTMKTYEQVKLIFASDCLYSFGLSYFVIICNFIPFFTIYV